MQLNEVINEIVEKKFANVVETRRPRELAHLLRIGEMDARRLMESGRNQRKQFEIFMRLLPVCKELGIDPARDLESGPSSPEERINHVQKIIKGMAADKIPKNHEPRGAFRTPGPRKKRVSPRKINRH